MRPAKYLTGDKYVDVFYHNGTYWFCETLDDDIFVVPAVGDIIEYENGERTIVSYCSVLNKDDELSIDIRMNGGVGESISRKGKRHWFVTVTGELVDGDWPMPGCKVIRDGCVILPVSRYFYIVNNLILSFRVFSKKLSALRDSASKKLSAFLRYFK